MMMMIMMMMVVMMMMMMMMMLMMMALRLKLLRLVLVLSRSSWPVMAAIVVGRTVVTVVVVGTEHGRRHPPTVKVATSGGETMHATLMTTSHMLSSSGLQ
jgi:hypothetical protein